MKIRPYLPISLLILLAVGIVWADQSGSKQKSGSTDAESSNKPPHNSDITWLKYDDGLELAKKEGKKVFVEFTARWCGYCRKMRATTFKDPSVIELLNEHYISVSVDGDSRDTLVIDGWITSERKLARQFRVTGYPTFWFLTPDAKPIAPVKGYRDAKTLTQILDYLKDDLYKTVKFDEYLAKKRQEERKKDK